MNVRQFVMKHAPNALIDFIASVNMLRRGDLLQMRRQLADERHRRQLLATQLVKRYGETIGRSPRPPLNQHEWSVYSQNGEDGILLYLFDLLGVTNRRFVEFGVEDGRECCSALFALHFGWSGLLMEADGKMAQSARQFYARELGDEANRVRIESVAVSAENINDLLKNYGITGEIDLLSIDIDGNDYWVWQAIETVTPRIVVIEYNPSFGADAAVTVPYDPNFHQTFAQTTRLYHGASLAALTQLAQQKGYILAGCDAAGVNAFFVRRDVAADKLVAVSVEAAFFPSRTRAQVATQAEQAATIAQLPLVDVYEETTTI